MKIGDLVVRAYPMPRIVRGIVVDRMSEHVQLDSDMDHESWYDETRIEVAWSDGTTSKEMECELEYFNELIASMSLAKEIEGQSWEELKEDILYEMDEMD